MAHPHHEHRAHKVEKSRVSHMTKGCYARGGSVHPDEAEDKALVKKMVKREALKVDGEKSTHRADRPHRAKGGRVGKGKSKGSHVNVIVNSGHPMPPVGGPPMVPPPAPAMAPPAMPPRPPMGAMPPGGPAGPVPGLGPMPPRATGGRAYAKGGAVKSGPAWEEGRRLGTQVQHNNSGKNDLGENLHRGKPITYKKGGKVCRADGGRIESPDGVSAASAAMPGGVMSGEGRLEQAHREKRRR